MCQTLKTKVMMEIGSNGLIRGTNIRNTGGSMRAIMLPRL